MYKWGIHHSTWYYVWGMLTTMLMLICNAAGISIWIYCLPVAIIGSFGLGILRVYLEHNLHAEETDVHTTTTST